MKICLVLATVCLTAVSALAAPANSPFVQHAIPGTNLKIAESEKVLTAEAESIADAEARAQLGSKKTAEVLSDRDIDDQTAARIRKEREKNSYRELNTEWRVNNK